MRNFLTLTGKSALRCFYPLTLFFNLAAVKKLARSFFIFPRGGAYLLESQIFYVFCLLRRNEKGRRNSARVKNILACVNGNFFALGKDNQRRVSSPKFRLLNRIAENPPAPSKRGVNRLFYRNWKFNNASFLVYARGIFFYWINGFIENLSAILNARFYRIFFCALKNFFVF